MSLISFTSYTWSCSAKDKCLLNISGVLNQTFGQRHWTRTPGHQPEYGSYSVFIQVLNKMRTVPDPNNLQSEWNLQSGLCAQSGLWIASTWLTTILCQKRRGVRVTAGTDTQKLEGLLSAWSCSCEPTVGRGRSLNQTSISLFLDTVLYLALTSGSLLFEVFDC